MDLSKLPKLSGNRDTDKPQDGVQPDLPAEGTPPPVSSAEPAPVAYEAQRHEAPGVGPDALLSLVIGAVLMMVGRGFVEWLIAAASGKVYDTGYTWDHGAMAGQIVPYWDVEGCAALSESTVFLFGFALVVGGLVALGAQMLPRGWRTLMFGAWLLMLLATAYNAVAIAILLRNDITPIWATLLTGLGAYEAWIQWRLLRDGAAGA